jgi:hypothetical protein
MIGRSALATCSSFPRAHPREWRGGHRRPARIATRRAGRGCRSPARG